MFIFKLCRPICGKKNFLMFIRVFLNLVNVSFCDKKSIKFLDQSTLKHFMKRTATSKCLITQCL